MQSVMLSSSRMKRCRRLAVFVKACIGLCGLIMRVVDGVSSTVLLPEHERFRPPGCQPRCPEDAVIVVGAGIAGLVAARALTDHGCKVVVLEAREHMGGRLYSEPMDNGTWVYHHGANWLHGRNALFDVNEREHLVGVQWLPRTYLLRTRHGVVHRFEGNRSFIPGAVIRQDYLQYHKQHAYFKRWLEGVLSGHNDYPDLPQTYFMDEYLNARNITGANGDALDEDQLDAFLTFEGVYNTLMEGDDLSRVGNMALLAKEYGQDREWMVGPPGYMAIASRIAEGLNIQYGEEAKVIEHGAEGALVHTKRRVYSGSAVVVTVPLGVLKARDVAFEPDLPSWKWRAICGLNLGVMDKVYLKWHKAWWSDDDPDAFWRMRDADGPFKITSSEWYNLHNYGPREGGTERPAVLLSTPTGYWAKILEEMTDAEVVEVMLQELRTIFPERRIPVPTAIYRTKWWKDRFARGSYMSPPVGSDPSLLWYMMEPVGRVLFAGEATSERRFGYADGAFVTGFREAFRLMCNGESVGPNGDYKERDTVIEEERAARLGTQMRDWLIERTQTIERFVQNA